MKRKKGLVVLGVVLFLSGSVHASWLKGKLRIGMEGGILSAYPTTLATVEISSFTSYEIMPETILCSTTTMYFSPVLQNFWQTLVKAEYALLPTLDLSLILGVAALRARDDMKETMIFSVPGWDIEERYQLEEEAQYEFPGVHFVYGGGAKFCYPVTKVCFVGIKGQYLVHNPHQLTYDASLRFYDETGTLLHEWTDDGTGKLGLTDWETTVFGKFLFPKPILRISVFSIGLNYLGLKGKVTTVSNIPDSPFVEYDLKPSNCWGLEIGTEFAIKNLKILVENRLLNINLMRISCLYNF